MTENDKTGQQLAWSDESPQERKEWQRPEGPDGENFEWAGNFPGCVGWLTEHVRDRRDMLLVDLLQALHDMHASDRHACLWNAPDDVYETCETWDLGYRSAVRLIMNHADGAK